jgi:hypothetical protein
VRGRRLLCGAGVALCRVCVCWVGSEFEIAGCGTWLAQELQW